MIQLNFPAPAFVAYFDVLGTKRLIAADTLAAWALLQKLLDEREAAVQVAFRLEGSQELIKDRVRHFAFSDSVVFYTQTASDLDLHAISLSTVKFFLRCIWNKVPIRGGIAVGDWICDEGQQLFTGSALVEAHKVGENTKWIGLAASEDFAARAAELPLKFQGRGLVFCRCELPTTDGLRPGSALDWPDLLYDSKRSTPSAPEDVYLNLSASREPFTSLPSDVRDKYQNTVEFMNSRLAAARNWERA